jgi:uncharacterized protein (TIGR02118 family)
MINVSVFYPNEEGKKFDMEYYVTKHIPMVQQKLGDALKGTVVEQGLVGSTPGSPAAYIAIAHLSFDSVAAFQSAFGPHAKSFMADLPNYSNIQPMVQISEVKL